MMMMMMMMILILVLTPLGVQGVGRFTSLLQTSAFVLFREFSSFVKIISTNQGRPIDNPLQQICDHE